MQKQQSLEAQALMSKELEGVHYHQQALHKMTDASKEKKASSVTSKQKMNEQHSKFTRTE